MPKFITKISKKAGLPPGTLVHVGDKKTEEVRINLIDYDEGHFQDTEIETIEECFPFKDKPSVTWININGLHQVDVIERLGRRFDIHPLVLEDIMHTGQRPKAEDFDEYIFLVLKMLYYDKNAHQVKAEQVSLILGSNFLISFQEQEGDVFSTVRDRIRIRVITWAIRKRSNGQRRQSPARGGDEAVLIELRRSHGEFYKTNGKIEYVFRKRGASTQDRAGRRIAQHSEQYVDKTETLLIGQLVCRKSRVGSSHSAGRDQCRHS